MTNQVLDEVISFKEACEVLRVSRNTFEAFTTRADFPRAIDYSFNKPSKKQFRRWIKSELVAWAKKQRQRG